MIYQTNYTVFGCKNDKNKYSSQARAIIINIVIY